MTQSGSRSISKSISNFGRRTRSTYTPCRISLGRSPEFGVIQVAALLDMSRMGRRDGIGQAQKTLGNDSGYFEAVEVRLTYFA
jgi:hypothetical protein